MLTYSIMKHEQNSEFLNLDLDILCVIAFQNKATEHHQSINEIVKEAKQGIYVVYCNALCESYSDGSSAFFGNVYREVPKEFIDAGFTQNDGIVNRIIEIPAIPGCIIVECDLDNKLVTLPNRDGRRSNVTVERPFVFKDDSLRQLEINELKQRNEKGKEQKKEEYQPTIPSVKLFTSKYIGRQDDIDYLKEFFSNKGKHFLLLYGVGGMGKSHLLYECIKEYKGKTFFFHAVSPNEEFSLNKLYELCLLPKLEGKKSIEEKQNQFIEKFQENNVHLILDDYYEVQLPEVKSLLPKLIGLGRGKMLLLSRIIPSNINHLRNDFLNHKILPLLEESFKTVIQNYAVIKCITLTDEEIHLIYEKAQGYPLGGQLIVDAKPYSPNLNELLNDISKYEAELDPEGKDYSGRLLNRIFQKGEPREIKLLCEFSALFGLSEIETIQQLPSYNLKLFEGLHARKGFVDMDAQGKFSSHAMIRDFSYSRLQDREALHLKMAKYFEGKINGRTDEDWKYLNEAILHYSKTRKEELLSFKYRVERKFESRNIKGLIDKSITRTIRNCLTLINLYPDRPAYYNELGIAYRINKQQSNAIETFLRALEIDEKHLPSLNELGITYRENNQKAKAIETFLRALEIDEKHLPSLNELGITYRENNQVEKAIKTCNNALKISEQGTIYLNLLQIFLLFKPNKLQASDCFERVFSASYIPKSLKDAKKKYTQVLNKLDSIWDISLIDYSDYKEFIQLAIQYKSYEQVLLILQELNKEFPDSSKIKSGLGKTLSNSVIKKYEEGQKYLREAIELFKKENNKQQLQSHIIYYLYNLKNHEQTEFLEKEFKRLKSDLVEDADYLRFEAHYTFYKTLAVEKAIPHFEKAIKIAPDNEKREFVESLLRFLDENKNELYKTYFKKYENIL